MPRKLSPILVLFLVLFLYGVFGSAAAIIFAGSTIDENNAFRHLIIIIFSQGLFILIPSLLFSTQRSTPNSVSKFLQLTRPSFLNIGFVFVGILSLQAIISLAIEIQLYLMHTYLDVNTIAYIEMYQAQIELLIGSDATFILPFIGIVLTPAICEEILFRGYLQGTLSEKYSFWQSVILTGIIFGMFHLDPFQSSGLIIAGIYLSFIKQTTQNLWMSIFAHFVNNFISLIVVIVRNTKEIDLEEVLYLKNMFSMEGMIVVAISAAGLFFTSYYLTKQCRTLPNE